MNDLKGMDALSRTEYSSWNTPN